MSTLPLLLSSWTDSLPEPIKGYLDGPLGLVVLVVVPALVVYFLANFTGALFRQQPRPPEEKLREDLSTYPWPPGTPGPRRLTVEGVPGRVRLVVVAPVGKGRPIDQGKIEDSVNHVIRGLKEIIQKDKPRIRCWPPQLSNVGFAPIFHRETVVPEGEGEESPWVLVAGPANAAGQPILLGLAILTDEPTQLGQLTVTPERWAETVRVQTIEA